MPLGAFILRRLGLGMLSMLGVSVLVFLFLHLIPGDAVDHLAGGEATPEQREKIEQCMGLDRSLPIQFVTFLGHIVDGDGRKEVVLSLRFPTVRTIVVYTAPGSAQRLELAGESESFPR